MITLSSRLCDWGFATHLDGKDEEALKTGCKVESISGKMLEEGQILVFGKDMRRDELTRVVNLIFKRARSLTFCQSEG